jgi:hypothetical protein
MIIPPEYPTHRIGDDYSVITDRGVVTCAESQAETVELQQYIEDKSNEFICERQHFRREHNYRFFYRWIQRYKGKFFRKIIETFDEWNAVASPRYRTMLDRTRAFFFEHTDDLVVFPPEFDLKTDDVDSEEYNQIVTARTALINDRMLVVAAECSRVLSEFFNEIRAVSVLMQLNFQELHALDVLPPALKRYSADLKWKGPSIYHDKMRESELLYQQKLAGQREGYISKYFPKVCLVFAGNLVLKARDVIVSFLKRFDPASGVQNRAH